MFLEKSNRGRSYFMTLQLRRLKYMPEEEGWAMSFEKLRIG